MVNPMRLDGYLKRKGLSSEAFAAQLSAHLCSKVSRVTVSQYRNGARIPRREQMIAIYELTGGEVDPNSFYDLPPMQLDIVTLAETGRAA